MRCGCKIVILFMICALLAINAEEVDNNYEEYDDDYPAYYDEDYNYDEDEYNEEEEEASGSSEDEYPDYEYSYQVSNGATNLLLRLQSISFFSSKDYKDFNESEIAVIPEMKSLPQSFTVAKGGTARFPCVASVRI